MGLLMCVSSNAPQTDDGGLLAFSDASAFRFERQLQSQICSNVNEFDSAVPQFLLLPKGNNTISSAANASPGTLN